MLGSRNLLGSRSTCSEVGTCSEVVIVLNRNATSAREAEPEAGNKPEDDQQILGGGPQDRVAAIRHV